MALSAPVPRHFPKWGQAHPVPHGSGATDPKVILYTKFEHFGFIHFWVMLRTLVRKMHLLALWPWPLTFKLQNHVTSRVIPKVIPYTYFEHFGIICFLVNAEDKRTDRQTK